MRPHAVAHGVIVPAQRAQLHDHAVCLPGAARVDQSIQLVAPLARPPSVYGVALQPVNLHQHLLHSGRPCRVSGIHPLQVFRLEQCHRLVAHSLLRILRRTVPLNLLNHCREILRLSALKGQPCHRRHVVVIVERRGQLLVHVLLLIALLRVGVQIDGTIHDLLAEHLGDLSAQRFQSLDVSRLPQRIGLCDALVLLHKHLRHTGVDVFGALFLILLQVCVQPVDIALILLKYRIVQLLVLLRRRSAAALAAQIRAEQIGHRADRAHQVAGRDAGHGGERLRGLVGHIPVRVRLFPCLRAQLLDPDAPRVDELVRRLQIQSGDVVALQQREYILDHRDKRQRVCVVHHVGLQRSQVLLDQRLGFVVIPQHVRNGRERGGKSRRRKEYHTRAHETEHGLLVLPLDCPAQRRAQQIVALGRFRHEGRIHAGQPILGAHDLALVEGAVHHLRAVHDLGKPSACGCVDLLLARSRVLFLRLQPAGVEQRAPGHFIR